MNPATPKTELSPSTQLRKAVIGGSPTMFHPKSRVVSRTHGNRADLATPIIASRWACLIPVAAALLLAVAAPTKASAQASPPAALPPFVSHWIDRHPTWLTSVHQVVLADLDGDGDLDWTVGNVHGQPNLFWYEYRDPDTWVKHLITNGPAIDDVYGGVAAIDVNNDGAMDLISGPFLFLNGGKGASWKMYNVKTSDSACHDHQAVDINRDGKLDILSTSANQGRVCWYKAPADPTQPWTEHYIGKAPEGYSKFHASTHSEAAADLDGDGDIDVAVALGWFENVDGKGLVWKPHWNKLVGVEGTYNVGVKTVCRDMDGDGDIDVVQSECDTKGVVKIAWLENDGHGNFTRHIIKEGFTEDYHTLKVFDYDNDGYLDVLTAVGPLADPSLSKNVLLFENTAGPGKKPVFTEHVLLTFPGDFPHDLCAGDVDRDGDPDIIVKGWDKASPFIYLENRSKQAKP